MSPLCRSGLTRLHAHGTTSLAGSPGNLFVFDPFTTHPGHDLIGGRIRHGKAEPPEGTGPSTHDILRKEPWKFRPRFTERGRFCWARRRPWPAVAPARPLLPLRRRVRLRPLRSIARRLNG